MRLFQSSPAPRRGRYPGTAQIKLKQRLFQSSPAPRRGRYQNHDWNQGTADCFNPRPRRGAGATSVRPFGESEQWMFQSSPAPRRGRYAISSVALAIIGMFQSSPAPRRGRYCNARPARAHGGCFNPRPRRGAGATYATRTKQSLTGVSILARAEARALPLAFSVIDAVVLSFQSSPAPRRGRYAFAAGRLGVIDLVSILARAEARALRFERSKPRLVCISFNPRPRRGAGATEQVGIGHRCRIGFNPRPRRGAGATPQGGI